MTMPRSRWLLCLTPSATRAPVEASWLTSRSRPLLLGVTGVMAAFVMGAVAVVHLRLAMALLLGAAAVAATLVSPRMGGLLLVALVPITSGLAPGTPVPNVRVSEALIGAIGVTVLVSARRRDAVPWTVLDWLLLGYGLAWAGTGILDARALGEHLSLSEWGTIAGQLQFFLLYRGVRVALRSPAERRLGVFVLLGASVPVGVLAILQNLHFPAVGRFINTITGGVYGLQPGVAVTRATGPFDNWAALAGYLFPLLLVLLALAIAGELRHHQRRLWAVAGIAVVALLLTRELSAIFCLVVGAGFLVTRYRGARRVRRWLAPALLVGVLVAVPFLGGRLDQQFAPTPGTGRHAWVPQTLGFRAEVWSSQYLPAIAARPLSGYGVIIPPRISWQYPESEYIELLTHGGIPLLVVFALLGWAMVARARAVARAPDPFDAALGWALLVSVAGLLAMNVIWPYLSNGGLPQVLWCLFALAGPLPARSPHAGVLAVPTPARGIEALAP